MDEWRRLRTPPPPRWIATAAVVTVAVVSYTAGIITATVLATGATP